MDCQTEKSKAMETIEVKSPSFRGSGIMMRIQFRKETLVKGDHCWDADEGYLGWNGRDWEPIEDMKFWEWVYGIAQ